MENNFQDSLSLMEHLVRSNGELKFFLSATPYGLEFHWGSYIPESDSVKKLKETLYFFDDEYHDDYDLETGTSREYTFKLENDILIGEINYEWNYSIGSKWLGRDLVELVKNEILTILSLETGLDEDEFLEKYYYRIVFSTEENSREDEFLVASWENEDEVEIALPVWADLKDSIIKLSHKHGANTGERDCGFDYDLNNEDYYIIERWSEEIDFEELKTDSVIFRKLQ